MFEEYKCPYPVLFLIFNRPQLAEICFERIRTARPPRLYLHCDGARPDREGEAEIVAISRKITEKVDWPCEVFTLFRPENVGLRKALSGAITWFFEHEEAGIIMEDDCLVDPSFFPFCAEMLDRYRHDEQVMHIGAWNLIEQRTGAFPADYFWTNFSIVTAFATWRRAWQKMDLEMAHLAEFERNNGIRHLIDSRPAQAYMLDKFRAVQALNIRSWAYAWFFSILQEGGICLLSSKNLVKNIGFGEGATNTGASNAASEIEASSISFPLRHPADKTIQPAYERQLFYAYQKRPFRLVLWYLLHLLKLR